MRGLPPDQIVQTIGMRMTASSRKLQARQRQEFSFQGQEPSISKCNHAPFIPRLTPFAGDGRHNSDCVCEP